MTDRPQVTRLGRDTFLVLHGEARSIVYVAGPPADRWAFWNGQVYRSGTSSEDARHASVARGGTQAVTAPMPASVIKILVTPGATVAAGQTLVVLEAMKMELPVRALESGTVKGVHCREGDLVQAEQVLVDIE